ncbi:hypothetical protein B0H14DRAFT_3859924 [Mycena olivaceomarginata]|nr:hypothetical protein B0H14DRAFT_3859924 [Mycena olivaceomarginata]
MYCVPVTSPQTPYIVHDAVPHSHARRHAAAHLRPIPRHWPHARMLALLSVDTASVGPTLFRPSALDHCHSQRPLTVPAAAWLTLPPASIFVTALAPTRLTAAPNLIICVQFVLMVTLGVFWLFNGFGVSVT